MWGVALNHLYTVWWVVYCQIEKRFPFADRAANKIIGSGSRYALQTFVGTKMMVDNHFRSSMIGAYTKREEALNTLRDMNTIDMVMNG